MNAVFTHDDIFEYITNHVSFYDYYKLKGVSLKFNRIFNIKSKKYAEIMNIKDCNIMNIMNVIETRVFNKYHPNKFKSINKTLLYHCWYKNQYPTISKYFTRIITLNCGECVEYLIALLYNSEYSNHRNIVKIFDNIDKNIAICPLNNVINAVIMVCCKILEIRNNTSYKFKSTYKYRVYNTNICIYISMLIKALHNSIISNNILNIERYNSYFSIANMKLNQYKYTIQTDKIFIKIFPKYYLKRILDIIEDSYI
jgi:hypothetical protein